MGHNYHRNTQEVSEYTTQIISTYPADDLEMVRLASVEAAALNMVNFAMCEGLRIFLHTLGA